MPYFPEASEEYLSTSMMEVYVLNNTGEASEFRVWGLVGIWDLGFWVLGLGCRV